MMLKVGLAACSTLTLGCVCLGGPLLFGGCTGGGTRAPAMVGLSSSSSRFTDSIIPRIDDCDVAVVGREPRPAASSFCGGAGGSSSCESAGESAEAPRGPRGSSTLSRRVGCGTPMRRLGLGLPGDLGAVDALGAGADWAG